MRKASIEIINNPVMRPANVAVPKINAINVEVSGIFISIIDIFSNSNNKLFPD